MKLFNVIFAVMSLSIMVEGSQLRSGKDDLEHRGLFGCSVGRLCLDNSWCTGSCASSGRSACINGWCQSPAVSVKYEMDPNDIPAGVNTDVTFLVEISNDTGSPVTITNMEDTIIKNGGSPSSPWNIGGLGTCLSGDIVIAPGDQYSCSYSDDYTLYAGDAYVFELWVEGDGGISTRETTNLRAM